VRTHAIVCDSCPIAGRTRLRGGGGGGDGDGGGDSLPLRYWAKYLDLLDTKPLATRMVTGFVIGTFGDVLSQYMSGGEFSDPRLRF